MKSKSVRFTTGLILCLVLVLSAACSSPTVQEAVEAPVVEEGSGEAPVVEDSNDGAASEAAAQEVEAAEAGNLEQEEESEDSLPPEPQQVPFLAADGYEQVGTYYPGAKNPGPLVFLMHWAPGDQTDWDAIAPWLQNRGMPAPENVGPEKPWLDASWFPDLGENNSFGVFAFTFRHCEGGCSEFDREGWLNDAYGAYEAALTLPGVDPERMVIIGASIGADGAADACLDGCLGALSLSPGDYLGVNYSEAVIAAEEAGKPFWCLAAESDTPSYTACSTAEGEQYRSIFYPGSEHGMALVVPDTYDPDTMQVVLEFLDLTIGLK
ncbi:MAG: hypothetical protein JXA25_16605 [Anaerolineales bacterium]|nr:hypothetical protein [Anaerolineales bacterium]